MATTHTSHPRRIFLYKRYLILALSLVFGLDNSDRYALGLLLQNIKLSLHLSDLQLGVLTGVAFALFYALFGVAIGAMADRADRTKIISTTTALWGTAVAMCGLATSFFQLLVLRVGVAIGESGSVAPSHSLLADTFSRSERPRATATFYSASMLLSTILGYYLAGVWNQAFGWRSTFFVLGLLGIALAPVVALTLKEPRRSLATTRALTYHSHESNSDTTLPIPSLLHALRLLWKIKTYRCLLICFAIVCFFGYGIIQWQPAFFIRTYGVSTGQLGAWFTAIYGLGGALGTYAGGHLASRFAGGHEQLQLVAIALLYSAFGVLSFFIYATDSYAIALILMTVSSVTGCMTIGPLFATVQTLIRPDMRGVSISLLYLAANLIGLGLGPFAIGALSDILHQWVGAESLRYALIAMTPGYLIGAWYFWRASTTVEADILAADARP